MGTFSQKQNQSPSLTLAPSNTATTRLNHLPGLVTNVRRALGDQLAPGMLQLDVEHLEAGLTGSASPGFGHDFSQIPLHPPTAPAVRTKFAINKPGDRYEQEADRLAEQVMKTPAAQLEPACSGAAPECQMKQQTASEPERVQTQLLPGGKTGRIEAPPIVHEVLGASGRPLDAATRGFMEPRFGHDFSHVRVHTDHRASMSARALNAQAYTIGHNVVFASESYAPQSNQGRRLIAHELSHVLQQSTSQSVQRMIAVKDEYVDLSGYLDGRTRGYMRAPGEDVYTQGGATQPGADLESEIVSTMLSSERMFTLQGDTSWEAKGNLYDHVDSRKGIVAFAGLKKYSFPKLEEGRRVTKRNPDFWGEDGGNEAGVKEGVERQDAYDDVNQHPEEYALACKEATNITMLGGGRSKLTEDTQVSEPDWIPGDWGYITNTGSGPKIPGLEGENIIYVGNERFWGHFSGPNTYRTLQEWFVAVKGWNGKAEMKPTRKRPTKGLL